MTTTPAPRPGTQASAVPPSLGHPRRPWEPKPLVYLAGKMHAAGNWREPLVPGLGREPFGCPIDCGRFIFTGPHFVPFNGRRHEWMGWHIGVEQRFEGVCPEGARPRWLVPALCMEWIRRSDMIFGWIEDPTCHATLTEIGWAHMLGKPVYLAFKNCELQRDMWFICHCPRTLAAEHESATDGLRHALAWKALL
ncbi:MAG TPA: hypothetical protein PKE29_10200 [Phycisphaerales bacterium]|nr:hypothetical protein [Phycisphaerales bacterium]